jgi:hypothetical protein
MGAFKTYHPRNPCIDFVSFSILQIWIIRSTKNFATEPKKLCDRTTIGTQEIYNDLIELLLETHKKYLDELLKIRTSFLCAMARCSIIRSLKRPHLAFQYLS